MPFGHPHPHPHPPPSRGREIVIILIVRVRLLQTGESILGNCKAGRYTHANPRKAFRSLSPGVLDDPLDQEQGGKASPIRRSFPTSILCTGERKRSSRSLPLSPERTAGSRIPVEQKEGSLEWR